MTDYMKEAERLADEYAKAVHDGRDSDCVTLRPALLAHIQRGVPEGVGAFRHKETGQVRYTLIGGEHDEDEWEDVLIVPMLAAAPDQFRDAAKMMAEPAEVPSQHAGARMGTEEGGEAYTAGYFDGEAAGYARAANWLRAKAEKHAEENGYHEPDTGSFVFAGRAAEEWNNSVLELADEMDAALRGEVKP